jgi:hypothetical protein
MPSPATTVRNHVATVAGAALGVTVINDRLGRSAGKDGADVAAVFPESEGQKDGNINVLVVEVILAYHMAYEAEPKSMTVDPSVIEAKADLVRRAFQTQSIGGVDDFWNLNLTEIIYPDDPTGNKTRFEARFRAFAHNPAALG